MLTGGLKYWPAVFVGALASVSTVGYPLWRQLGGGVGDTLEPLIGAWLLLRSDRFEVALMHAEDYLRIFLGGIGGRLRERAGRRRHLCAGGPNRAVGAAGSLLHWYQGDILSILLLTPR